MEIEQLSPVAILDMTGPIDGCDKALFDEIKDNCEVLLLTDLASDPSKLIQLKERQVKTVAFHTQGGHGDQIEKLKNAIIGIQKPEFLIITSFRTLENMWLTLQEWQEEHGIIVLDPSLEPAFQ